MIMCVLLCYPVSIHMLQLQATGRPISSCKTIAFREFSINMLFSYFWVSYNIVKFQTCSSWHS